MIVEFNHLTYEGIMKLIENPCPNCELSKMSKNELPVLEDRIDKIALENSDNLILYGKLMRLKSFVMLEEKQ